jgi:exopolysaccharide biosynthesis protein
MKKNRWMIGIFSFLVLAFTIYVVSDTFLIKRVYSAVIDEEPKTSESVLIPEETTETDLIEPIITDTSYQDENMSISITTYEVNDTVVYVADIKVSSAEYLKTALAQAAYGKNVTDETSDIAESVNAILAVNGDYYGSQESGYVLRNGVLYRSQAERGQEDLVIYEDGSMKIIREDDVSAEELLESGAVQILSFGPALVENASVAVSEQDEVGKAKQSNPRTAVGIIDALHYIFVVSDGRTEESEGLSLYELAEFMQSLGAQTAYNLDGGGSSTMYFNGEVVNNPTTNGQIRERKVSDIVYFGY